MRFFPLLILFLISCGAPPEDKQAMVMDDLIEANVRYEYEKSMRLDSVQRFEFLLFKSIDSTLAKQIAPSLSQSANVADRSAMVGNYITAKLIDPSEGKNFNITPLSLETQSLPRPDSFALLWQWDIEPLQVGQLPLRLKVFTKMDEREIDIPVFDTTIDVFTPDKKKPLVPIFLALGAALLGLLLFFVFKRKKQAQKNTIPQALKDEIRHLAGEGKTAQALELMESHFVEVGATNLVKDIVVLQGRLREAKHKNNMGVLTNEDFRTEMAKVNYALLEMV